MFSPFSPVDIRILSKAAGLKTIESFVKDTNGLCILISETMIKRLDLTTFVDGLLKKQSGIWLKAIPSNPTVRDVCDALQALAGRCVGTILAIGGGSAMDLSKAIAALHGQLNEKSLTEDGVRKAIMEKTYENTPDIPRLIAVPTTAGTGSEVTRWATVWDPKRMQKLSVDAVWLFPKAAVIVPEFTMGMGQELTLSTGLDALSHAMEAYWAVSRTLLSKTLALCAVEKIRDSLPCALQAKNMESLALREEMCMGSLLAGLAFSITRTTACHAISYPLTMLHNVPHGFAAALTLSSVMRRNAEVLPTITRLQGMFDAEGGFDAWIRSLTAPIIPLKLSSFGICDLDLPAIADQSFTAGRMDNNPIVFDRQQILSILNECL